MEQENKMIAEEEISLKDILLKVRDFCVEIWNKRMWILITAIFIASVMFLSASLKPRIYEGKVTFMLDEEGKGNLGGVSSLLGQFGFGGNQQGRNLNRILDLSRSRIITQLVLFNKIEIDNKNDYLANHIILEYDYHEIWEESTIGLKDFLFSHDSVAIFNRAENTALKQLHKLIAGADGKGGLLSSSINENSGIMTILAETTSSEISFYLTEISYKNLTDYYKKKAVEKQHKTYGLFKSKTDSIQQALNLAQYRLSKFQDSNRNLTLRQYEIERRKLELEIQKLVVAFGETYKNLELADFALKSQTPFIQKIDSPLYPLDSFKPSKWKAATNGIMIGLVLSILFVLMRKILSDALQG